MQTVRIFVTYKPSVFDPQAATIQQAVTALGHDAIKKIAVGKFFDVQVDTSVQPLDKAVSAVAEELLVNFNLETYRYEVLEEA